MKPLGINRIILAVRDLQKAKSLYSQMLGATFHDASWTGEPLGMQVAISWDAGIELCAPMPGHEKDSMISGFLDQNGDGILSIVFGVQDADSTRESAEKLGIQALYSVDPGGLLHLTTGQKGDQLVEHVRGAVFGRSTRISFWYAVTQKDDHLT